MSEAEGDLRSRREPRLKLVVVISDGIRGHVNQSRGVAHWLEELSGAEVQELELPELRGATRWRAKRAARKLLAWGSRRASRDWLAVAGAEGMLRSLGTMVGQRGIRVGEPDRLLLISAGSTAAFCSLALGYIWRCSCATMMTPSVVGTEPFDFAIVPEHDFPRDASNVLVTTGAPNLVDRRSIGIPAESLLREHPPQLDRAWGVLIGGDDANYRISAEWVHDRIGSVLREAARERADIYMTTSRRTSPEAEAAIKRLAANSSELRFLLLASESSVDPVPAMLGACEEIFVTDDSVNMISEAATAGHRPVLLRTERPGHLRRAAQDLTASLARRGMLPRRWIWGVPRFEITIERFKRMGLLVEWEDRLRARGTGELAPDAPVPELCEARRAAEWILDGLSELEGERA